MCTTLTGLPTTVGPDTISHPWEATALGTVLGVWAHPDDEAYLSAGLMSLARAAGNRVVCVTATGGEHGTDDPERFPPAVLAAIRARELEASLAVLGVREHRLLGLEDGTLAELDAEAQTRRIHRLISWFQPDTIVTFGPDGMTGHPDHRAVSQWTTAAWRRSGRTGRLLHATTTASFADEFDHIHERLGVFGPGLPLRTLDEDVALVVDLDGAHLDRKVAALHRHRSQTEGVVAALGPDEFRSWWRTERFSAVAW